MKITELMTQKTSLPLKKPFKTALRTATAIEVMDVTLQLEDGERGHGSASSTWKITGESLESIQAAVEGPIKEAVVGHEIEQLEKILTDVQKSCVSNTSAKAAVDIALHDAYCKTFRLPLYQYLGGSGDFPVTDMTISIDDPEKMQESARQSMEQGFDVLKIKVGNEEELDIHRICRVREAVGDDVKLRLDANQGWNSKQAVKIIRILEEKAGLELVEQPVPARDTAGLKYIREQVETPIMADESIFSPADAFRLIKEEAVDLLNIKLMKCGGIRQARQIADMAQSAGVECMIGSMMESHLSVTAAAHLAFAHSNITKYDLDAALWLQDQPLQGGMQWQGKIVELPNRPGLGLY